MDIKKIFINCMIVLCVGVVILSVVTVVKRSNEPKEEIVAAQDVVENSEIIFDTETMESTEDIVGDETLETKTLYTTSKVNVRTGPGTSYDKVVELQSGIAITAIGEMDESGWQMIEYEGRNAYILGRYLTETVPEAENQNDQNLENQTTNIQQGQDTQQTGQNVQIQSETSATVWYLPVGNEVEQVITSQDTTTQQPTTTDTTTSEEVPETTPTVLETTPTVPETTPTVPEVTPTTPEVTPTTPEVTPEQTQMLPESGV